MSKRNRAPADPITAARDVARAEVARRWPELAGVEPTMTPRPQCAPARPEAERVGAAVAPAAAPSLDAAQYTFTFAGHTHTPDGYVMPRIARVTVDSHRRVVKAITSK